MCSSGEARVGNGIIVNQEGLEWSKGGQKGGMGVGRQVREEWRDRKDRTAHRKGTETNMAL